MSTVTVRSLVEEIQAEVKESAELLPARAADLLNRLTALYGNVLEDMTAADIAYNHVMAGALTSEDAANRAKVRAQTTPQYAEMRRAHNLEKLTVELIRTLKTFIKAKTEELRFS
jgi:hypothetical protein